MNASWMHLVFASFCSTAERMQFWFLLMMWWFFICICSVRVHLFKFVQQQFGASILLWCLCLICTTIRMQTLLWSQIICCLLRISWHVVHIICVKLWTTTDTELASLFFTESLLQLFCCHWLKLSASQFLSNLLLLLANWTAGLPLLASSDALLLSSGWGSCCLSLSRSGMCQPHDDNMFVVKTLSMLNRSNINMLARLTNLMAQLIDGSQIPLVLPSSPRQAGASDDALASPPPFLLFRTTLHPIRLLRQR